MWKFLKNPFGKKKEEITPRKSAASFTKSVQDKRNTHKPGQKRPQESKRDAQSSKLERDPKKDDARLEAGFGVILKPHVSEKTAKSGSFDTYVFTVSRNTNKVEVKKAFWRMYGVKPVSINIVNMPAQAVQFRRTSGVKSGWKKAYVRVPKNSNISVYEGV